MAENRVENLADNLVENVAHGVDNVAQGVVGAASGVADAAKAVVRRPRPVPNVSPDGTVVPRRRPMPGPPVLRAAPDVARVAAASAWHLVSWSVGATIAGANYVSRRAVAGEPATAILQEAASDLRAVAWRALGLPGGTATSSNAHPQDKANPRGSSVLDLQRRGTDLLRRSNDVHVIEDTHPAFARILADITPDEARILRYVYLEGPQPALDIRTYRPFGIGSELVASGMNMIAEHAGLRNVERIDLYLTNLSRLGMLEFSKEPVKNPTRYQVIEAQPKVASAMESAGRMPRIVQRSVILTSFGEEFVRTCLPLNGKSVPNREGSRPVPSRTVPSRTVPSRTVPSRTVPSRTVPSRTVRSELGR
ncbi:Abi-alpha family protein [uncultured Jatrophihabitans sp.]|uniref:Abi-alpha family protein n=1 Tax=uncultured Jatrophihabitans sp. TaxID=1610747 RepID=UPI0035CA867E